MVSGQVSHCVLNAHTHIHTHTETPYSAIPFTQKRSRTGRSPERKGDQWSPGPGRDQGVGLMVKGVQGFFRGDEMFPKLTAEVTALNCAL